jgi:hypothetical protein
MSEQETNSKLASEFYELSADTLETINNLVGELALPFGIKIMFLGTTKQKSLIKIKVASKEFQYKNHIDLIMYINEDYFIRLEKNNAEILMYQELDRLVFNIEKGTFKIAKYALQTTTGVLKKYGIDAVANANELSVEFTKQLKDKPDNHGQDGEVKKKRKNVEFLK